MENSMIVPLILDDGTQIKIEATGSKERDVTTIGELHISEITKLIKGIGASFKDVFESIGPNKVAIKLGLEVSVESGALTALIVKGTGKANFEISLEWAKS
jgi:hypothetical protein